MSKNQVLLLVIGAFVIVGLTLLPKVVINGDDHSEEEHEADQATVVEEGEVEKEQAAHIGSTTDEDKALLLALKSEFKVTEDKEGKIEAYNKLADKLRALNYFDSAAIYAEELSEFGDAESTLIIADAYYDAFVLASFNEAKSRRLAADAQEWYTKYLAKVKENSTAWNNARVKLGMTYVSSQNPMQGILMVRQVLENEPNNKLALFNMGVLSMQSGQWPKAVARFEKLVGLDTTNIENRFYLGVSYKEAGMKAQAKNELQYVRNNETNIEVLSTIDEVWKELE